MNQQIIETLKIVITTFICSALIMPFMKRIAKHIGAIDVPRADEGHRHIHTKATPKLGGGRNIPSFSYRVYALWYRKCANEFYFNRKLYYNIDRNSR